MSLPKGTCACWNEYLLNGWKFWTFSFELWVVWELFGGTLPFRCYSLGSWNHGICICRFRCGCEWVLVSYCLMSSIGRKEYLRSLFHSCEGEFHDCYCSACEDDTYLKGWSCQWLFDGNLRLGGIHHSGSRAVRYFRYLYVRLAFHLWARSNFRAPLGTSALLPRTPLFRCIIWERIH